jgi:hypothetical protein
MSDFEEPEDEEGELVKGMLSAFVHSLNPEQRLMWTPIRRAWRTQEKRAKEASGKSNRDVVWDAINRAQGSITPAKIERLIDNAVSKGDAQALRVIAQMAGIDLSDRPAQAAGEGAKVIIIRPHPLLLIESEEADIQRQIAEH